MERLQETETRFRALVRRSEKVDALRSRGVPAVPGELGQWPSIKAALSPPEQVPSGHYTRLTGTKPTDIKTFAADFAEAFGGARHMAGPSPEGSDQ